MSETYFSPYIRAFLPPEYPTRRGPRARHTRNNPTHHPQELPLSKPSFLKDIARLTKAAGFAVGLSCMASYILPKIPSSFMGLTLGGAFGEAIERQNNSWGCREAVKLGAAATLTAAGIGLVKLVTIGEAGLLDLAIHAVFSTMIGNVSSLTKHLLKPATSQKPKSAYVVPMIIGLNSALLWNIGFNERISCSGPEHLMIGAVLVGTGALVRRATQAIFQS